MGDEKRSLYLFLFILRRSRNILMAGGESFAHYARALAYMIAVADTSFSFFPLQLNVPTALDVREKERACVCVPIQG